MSNPKVHILLYFLFVSSTLLYATLICVCSCFSTLLVFGDLRILMNFLLFIFGVGLGFVGMQTNLCHWKAYWRSFRICRRLFYYRLIWKWKKSPTACSVGMSALHPIFPSTSHFFMFPELIVLVLLAYDQYLGPRGWTSGVFCGFVRLLFLCLEHGA